LDHRIYEELRNKVFPKLNILDLLSGGEAFACKYIDEVLYDMKKYDFKTTIESNFSVITNRQREFMVSADVRFIVSLDGSTKALQEFMRPQCNYEKVLENISFFVKNKKRVTIRMTISNYNFYDMQRMMKLGEKLGVEGIIFHGAQYLECLDRPLKFEAPPVDREYIHNLVHGHYKINYDLWLDYHRRTSALISPMRAVYCVMDPLTALGAGTKVKIANLWAMMRRKEYCPISRSFIKVDVDGQIYFCSCHECKAIGNLSENTLEQIMDNDRYDRIRRVCSCKISKRETHAVKGN
jgi:sulfatase maturation enzyme AslB (radical SAM superfamily)